MPSRSDAGRTTANRAGRMLVVKISMIAAFCAVVVRLVQVQVIDAKGYQEKAKQQSEVPVPLPAARGNMYDRNGTLLVSNTMTVSLAADPKLLGTETRGLAVRMAHVFDRPSSFYLDRLDGAKRFVYLERRISPQLAHQVKPADFEGVVQLEEPRRLYHYGQLAGQLVGVTDVDNNGLSGLELECNAILQGRNGFMVMQRDALGRRRTSVEYPRVDPVNGHSIVLTIDVSYQAIAEEELRKGVERADADGGIVVMLDPATGEVLAMVNYPSADPNNPTQLGPEALRNRAIMDMFEPGSVFKVVTASAALQDHLVAPGAKYYAENGLYRVPIGRGKTRPITDDHPYGTLTFREAMEVSSNIVMAKISNVIGPERLYTMARNYGFGNETGIDLPAEVRGELKRPDEWSGTTLNSMAFGYEVGVTPIQIACAYAAVANHGVLMRPFVIRRVVDDRGTVLTQTRPEVIRTVLSRATADTLTSFLEGVVTRGTGVGARLAGVSVAGKTGTSRKYIDGKYETGNYTASFVGFFPADDPKVVCLVMLDHPRVGGYTGGSASAPIFHGIAEKIYATSARFAPKQNVRLASGEFVVPDVTMLTVDAARAILTGQGFDVSVEGTGAIVTKEIPEQGSHIEKGGDVRLVANGGKPGALQAGLTVVPDLRGLTMRRALNRLATNQLDGQLRGSGIVSAQSPAAGTQVRPGSRVLVRCVPRSFPWSLN
jgi:cell division protein FtsI (penicillin-binding protein 3)